ncbi:two component transcriptional regulator, LytTR family [Ruminococcaceae bacterium YRB3002]|nr:two component transcriptional regulator, LytTR family [Ruminococcaceae bacterium YRB3002]
MFNVAIFDDVRMIRDEVIEILNKRFEGRFNYITAPKAPDLIASASVIDILIMDINIGSSKAQNGIEIAERIKKNNSNCQVIFISGYSEYAQQIFDARPVFFISKPIDEEVLCQAINISIDNLVKSRAHRFSYQKESRIYIVSLEDIMYFESNRRIVKIYTTDGMDTFYDTMNAIEDRIKEDFIRIHQSYLVNPRYISTFMGNEIILNDGTVLPVSKPRMANVRQELIRLFTEE